MARVVMTLEDDRIVNDLATALVAAGHSVITRLDGLETSRRPFDTVEITISDATGQNRGLLVTITNLASHGRYAGAFAHFVKQPATVAEVMEVIAQFDIK